MLQKAHPIEVRANAAPEIGWSAWLTANDQDGAEPLLQTSHSLRDGGRGDSQCGGPALERPFANDSIEGRERRIIHH